MTAGGRDNRYVHRSPLESIYEVMPIHPDLNCRYQNRALIIYTVCTVPLIHVLVPLQLHKDKPSIQAVDQFAQQKSRIYTMRALSNISAMFFMFLIYTMALLMKCMPSLNKHQPNMVRQEHVYIRKSQMTQNQKRSQNL